MLDLDAQAAHEAEALIAEINTVNVEIEIMTSQLKHFTENKICREDVVGIETIMSSPFITEQMPLAGFTVSPSNMGRVVAMEGMFKSLGESIKKAAKATGKFIMDMLRKLASMLGFGKSSSKLSKDDLTAIKEAVDPKVICEGIWERFFNTEFDNYLNRNTSFFKNPQALIDKLMLQAKGLTDVAEQSIVYYSRFVNAMSANQSDTQSVVKSAVGEFSTFLTEHINAMNQRLVGELGFPEIDLHFKYTPIDVYATESKTPILFTEIAKEINNELVRMRDTTEVELGEYEFDSILKELPDESHGSSTEKALKNILKDLEVTMDKFAAQETTFNDKIAQRTIVMMNNSYYEKILSIEYFRMIEYNKLVNKLLGAQANVLAAYMRNYSKCYDRYADMRTIASQLIIYSK